MDVGHARPERLQLTRAITPDPLYADVPIIMCTSKNQEPTGCGACGKGARRLHHQPVDADERMAKIKALS